MRELSIMVDESGEWGKLSKYYLITLVFHDQSEPVMPHIERYEQHLADASLPDIPFHAGPLLNGHADYETLSMADRKRLFVAFFTLARNLPFTYVTFAHRKSEFDNDKRRFEAQLRRDLANYLLTHLDRFQSYDTIKIYYDNGQQVVTNALKASIGYALSKEAVIYRKADPKDYRLEQAADLMCTIELTALKFKAGENTENRSQKCSETGAHSNRTTSKRYAANKQITAISRIVSNRRLHKNTQPAYDERVGMP